MTTLQFSKAWYALIISAIPAVPQNQGDSIFITLMENSIAFHSRGLLYDMKSPKQHIYQISLEGLDKVYNYKIST